MGQTELDDYTPSDRSECDQFEQSRQLEYVAVTGRHPWVCDAYELGFAPGIREDYGSFQTDQYPNVSLPVYFLDNNFHDPDLDRYLDIYDRHDPDIAVLGDAYSPRQAYELDTAAAKLQSERSDLDIVVTPKCRAAFDILEDDIILGYPVGYSELDPFDYSDITDWRGRRVHILGGSPPVQYEAIQQLTQPTLTDDPPADITGTDWNGMVLGAYKGEYWTPDGWQPANHLSIRETVQHSLEAIKTFWQDKELWPETEPIDRYGPAVQVPDDEIFMDQGGDPIPSRDALERAYVDDYGENGTLAFASETAKKFYEYRSDLLASRPADTTPTEPQDTV